MLGNTQSDGTRQFVAVALDERIERLVDIQLWVQVAWRRVEDVGRLVGTAVGCGHVNVSGLVGNDVLRQFVCLVGNDAVIKPDLGLEAVGQCPIH